MQRMGQKTPRLIPAQTRKQPKPKNQTPPQPNSGMGKLQRNPSPQRNKKGKNIETVTARGINSANKAKKIHAPTPTPTLHNIAPCIVCGANQAPHTAIRLERSLNPKSNPLQTPKCGVGV